LRASIVSAAAKFTIVVAHLRPAWKRLQKKIEALLSTLSSHRNVYSDTRDLLASEELMRQNVPRRQHTSEALLKSIVVHRY
jgi:hypothetical protein